MVEQETQIVEMTFGIPVPRDLAVAVQASKNPAKGLEHLRANMNGVVVRIEDGVHRLAEDEELLRLTKVRHELRVEVGKAAITPIHDGARLDTVSQYGDLTRRLEKPGDIYFSHSMQDGFIKSLIACVVTSS